MATATAAKTAKGFKVACPYCTDEDATVRLDLNALQTCECSSCGQEFSVRDAVAKLTAQLKRWEAIGRWIDLAGEAMSNDAE